MNSIDIDDSVPQFMCLPTVEHPKCSPDGTSVAFFWNPCGEFELYTANVASGSVSRLFDRQFSNPSPMGFLWDSDGSQVFVTGGRIPDDRSDESPATMIRGIDLSGDVRTVTAYTGSCILWDVSPTGRYLAWIERGTDGPHLRYLDRRTDDQDAFPVYPQFVYTGGGYAPDGSRVAYSTNETDDPQHSDVYVAEPDGRDARRLDAGVNGRKTVVHDWFPDNRRLLLSEDTDDGLRCGVYDIEVETIRWFDRPTATSSRPVAVLPDGSGFLAGPRNSVVYSLVGESRPLRINGEARFEATVGRAAFAGPDTLVCRSESPARPPTIIQYDLCSDAITELIAPTSDGLAPPPITEPERITYPGIDGTEFEALYYDSGNRPSPAVVFVYGARRRFRKSFDRPAQALVASGYSVLRPSHGGDKYAPNPDFAAAGRWLTDRLEIDADRIAVCGFSHGGYDTLMQLLQYPNIWAAGVAYAPPTDLLALDKQDDLAMIRDVLGHPDENTDAWREHSPITHVDSLACPLLLIHGEDDLIVPVSQSRRFRDALLNAEYSEGEDFEYVEVPDHSHGTRDSGTKIDIWCRIIDFVYDRI